MSEMELDAHVMDSCKDKVSQFRVKELKDVLTFVGHSKQGRKQDLVDRIVALLYDEGTPGLFKNTVNGKEGLVEVINDVHRKMEEIGVGDSSTKKQTALGGRRMQPKEESEDSYESQRKIQCPCGGTSPTGSPLLECAAQDCIVWQHSGCVIIPENPFDKIPPPARFLCEVCRLERADPFWATVAHPLYAVKLKSTIPIDGTKPTQSVETTFKLTRPARDLLVKTDYDLQAWCILLNDSVPFRMQWPQYADLQVNGIPVQTVTRPVSQLLGANGRDDGATITLNTAEGVNKISLSGRDPRIFCFGVRLVKRRTLEQVISMIPKEPYGEPFEDALARVLRCIGGGMPTDNNDSDSDLEVIADSVTVNLCCPMSGSRMKMAGRFRGCMHMGCFDLETFVGLNERSRKWQCPICLRNYSLEDVVIDPFFNRIVKMMRNCDKDINEIDMKPDGSWRVKNARQVGNLGQWQCVDGSLELLPGTEIGHGNSLDCNTSKLDIHNNVDGPQGRCHSFMNQQGELGCDKMNVMIMSSTTTGNGQSDEEPSINQNESELVIHSSNENEVISVLQGSSGRHGFNAQNSTLPPAHADIIILSDSEDDDVSLVDPVRVHRNRHADHDGYSLHSPKILAPPTDATGEGPLIFSGNNGRTDTPYLFLSHAQGDSEVNFFGNSGALLEHNSGSHSQLLNTVLAPDSGLNPFHRVIDLNEPCHSLLNHQFASVNGDISLEVPVPDTSIHRNELVTSFCDNLGSLGQGANATEVRSNMAACHESAGGNLLDLQNDFMSDEDSLVQKTNGESDLTLGEKRLRLDTPFPFPRHRRSARKQSSQRVFSDHASK